MKILLNVSNKLRKQVKEGESVFFFFIFIFLLLFLFLAVSCSSHYHINPYYLFPSSIDFSLPFLNLTLFFFFFLLSFSSFLFLSPAVPFLRYPRAHLSIQLFSFFYCTPTPFLNLTIVRLH